MSVSTASRVTRPTRPWPAPALPALLVVAVAASSLTAPAVARSADGPSVSAPSAIVVELATGDIVFERRANILRGIASTTKLMTALLALEDGRLDRRHRITAYPGAAVESVAGLRAGDRMTMRDLLAGLMLPSGNDAAVAIARAVSGSTAKFVTAMNRRAKELGLRTRYRNPIGLDAEGHRGTATDLVKLTLLLREFPEFRRIVDEPSMRLTSASPPITVENRNTLVRDVPWVDGVKTGHTRKAGYALVASGRRRGVSVVSVVLGASSEAARNADSLALMRFALDRYVRKVAVRRSDVVARLPLRYRDDRVVEVEAARTVRRTARRDERLRTRVVGLPADVEGPLPKGSRLGTVEILQRGRVVARVPAVTTRAVAAATVWERVDDRLSERGVQVLIGLVLALLVALVTLVRRGRRSGPTPALSRSRG
ncbi:MAG: D-alanyl-D-alanine carboxypeptidase [Solirubrobacteraceae bacterium]|nr:D-alanyl-D-alanine carboxypeptidase [Solirubrobacteraceae bacterium]